MKNSFRFTFIGSILLLFVISFVLVFQVDLIAKKNQIQYMLADYSPKNSTSCGSSAVDSHQHDDVLGQIESPDAILDSNNYPNSSTSSSEVDTAVITADTADTANSHQQVPQVDREILLKDEYIRSRHAGCFADSMYKENNGVKTLDYTRVMKYSLLGKNVTKSVRFNHLCPWMKNRYNCATSETKEYGQSAHDWKLTLETETDQCDLWQLAHDIGGPVGLGKILKQRRLQNLASASSVNPDNTAALSDDEQRPHTVVMFGNSYVRQILESFACSWAHEVTDSLLQKDAKYSISVAALKARDGAPIRMDELGDIERMPMPWEGDGCELLEDGDKFYAENVTVPRMCKGYDNNLATLEFGNVLRFVYIFRPQIYEDMPALFERLDLQPEKVDSMIFNDNQELPIKNDDELKRRFSVTGAWSHKILMGIVYLRIQQFQKRDIGQWFGADNPGMNSPPDIHGCMPGPPDDQVNLILYLLYSNIGIS